MRGLVAVLIGVALGVGWTAGARADVGCPTDALLAEMCLAMVVGPPERDSLRDMALNCSI